jgi:hypothetical protein
LPSMFMGEVSSPSILSLPGLTGQSSNHQIEFGHRSSGYWIP